MQVASSQCHPHTLSFALPLSLMPPLSLASCLSPTLPLSFMPPLSPALPLSLVLSRSFAPSLSFTPPLSLCYLCPLCHLCPLHCLCPLHSTWPHHLPYNLVLKAGYPQEEKKGNQYPTHQIHRYWVPYKRVPSTLGSGLGYSRAIPLMPDTC